MGLKELIAERQRRFLARHSSDYVQHFSTRAVEDFMQGRISRAAHSVTLSRALSVMQGEDDLSALEAMRLLSFSQLAEGETEQTGELWKSWLQVVVDQLAHGAPFSSCLDHLEEILQISGDYSGITSLLRKAADHLRSWGNQERALIWVLRGLGRVARKAKRMADAEPPLQEAVELWQRLHGETG